ncbi:hypothetical protein [Natronolimnohabitans innermongolicus]|nr:hypothetical protein [Natronolimnohabitans innermongolicus]
MGDGIAGGGKSDRPAFAVSEAAERGVRRPLSRSTDLSVLVPD